MMQKRILSMAHIDKARVQIGHDLPDAADINVAHGVLHVSPITVELNELTVLEKGNADARRRRIDDEFGVHHMKIRDMRAPQQDVLMSRKSLLLVTVLAKTLLPLVRGHLVTLALFSAWHDDVV